MIGEEQKNTQAQSQIVKTYETDVFHDSLGMRVWELRHQFAAERLSQLDAKKILDVGCNTGKLIERLARNIQFIQIDGIDINEDILRNKASVVAKPDCIQNLYSYQRKQQLIVSLYKGSALNKNEFLKIQNYDAITLIEVIEHLRLYDLYLLEQNLFGYLRPKHVIITTPNSDFNVYFKFEQNQTTLNYLMIERGIKFRDSDHKFEWSQYEFTQWAQSIQRFGYQILEQTGVGLHKTDLNLNGFCSQIIIFQRDDSFERQVDITQLYQDLQDQDIELIAKYPYPFESREEYFRKYVVSSILCLLNKSQEQRSTEYDKCETCINLELVLQNEYIRECTLINNNYQNLNLYLQTFKEFIVFEDKENIQDYEVTENYRAKVELEQEQVQEEEEEIQAPPYVNYNDSGMDEEYSGFNNISNAQHWANQQQIQFNTGYFQNYQQQQINL